jgi:hypothetical protein
MCNNPLFLIKIISRKTSGLQALINPYPVFWLGYAIMRDCPLNRYQKYTTTV